jgi:hypothetical protein
VHEIRMILGNVAALCEPAITGIVPHRLPVPANSDHWPIRDNISTSGDPMLLSETSTAKSRSVPERCRRNALLLFDPLCCEGGVGKEKRQIADDKDIVIHGSLFLGEWMTPLPAAQAS